ncbi:MAG: YceI family protein [Pedobacter sp.]|nr:MAG: YceI family protein [Pedobacter sp.]
MHFFIFLLFSLFFPLQETVFECQNGTIHFVSEAPLELIQANSKQMKGVLRTQDQGFAFSVANSTFEGFNSPLQKEHFNENYMESKVYPKISFRGKIIEPIDFSKKGSYKVRAKGMLNAHGVDQERIIQADLVVNDKTVKISSRFNVLLQDHNISIPKIVYQKIAEEITVDVNATLTLK